MDIPGAADLHCHAIVSPFNQQITIDPCPSDLPVCPAQGLVSVSSREVRERIPLQLDNLFHGIDLRFNHQND